MCALQEWLSVLDAARAERVRNRVMLALAYDCGLRREEPCSLRTDDLQRLTGRCGCGRRRRRTGWNPSCRTRLLWAGLNPQAADHVPADPIALPIINLTPPGNIQDR